MKENIDLTENQIFRTPTFQNEITKALMIHIFGRFPWNEPIVETIESDDGLSGTAETFTPIPIGDGEARRHQKLIENALSVKRCDRCGQPVESFPWELRECLCEKCSQALESEYGTSRILTKYEEEIPNSTILDWF